MNHQFQTSIFRILGNVNMIEGICIMCKTQQKMKDTSKTCQQCTQDIIDKYHVNGIKQGNTCLQCDEEKKLYTCKMVNKCTIQERYCIDCSIDHQNDQCNEINVCFQCKKHTKQFYKCQKYNQCYFHAENEGAIFCQDCRMNHENELCNTLNKCMTCDKTAMYQCNRLKPCTMSTLFCKDCSVNHSMNSCLLINSCDICRLQLTQNNTDFSQKCVICSQAECRLVRCDMCYDFTPDPQGCNNDIKCNTNKNYCYQCSLLPHNEKCALENTCHQCGKVSSTQQCDKRNPCQGIKRYCPQCIRNHDNEYCKKLNQCLLCNKEALYPCKMSNQCSSEDKNLFCEEHSIIPHSDQCLDMNLCITCNQFEALYQCDKQHKCTGGTVSMYCEDCLEDHQNVTCQMINQCIRCKKNDGHLIGKYCMRCDYIVKNHCYNCNEFCPNSKQSGNRDTGAHVVCDKCSMNTFRKRCDVCKQNPVRRTYKIDNMPWRWKICEECDDQDSKSIQQMINDHNNSKKCKMCNNKCADTVCKTCVRQFRKSTLEGLVKSELNDLVCSICQDEENEIENQCYMLPNCESHHFHKECMKNWIITKKHQTNNIEGDVIHDDDHVNSQFPCPMCKKDYYTSMLVIKTDEQQIRELYIDKDITDEYCIEV